MLTPVRASLCFLLLACLVSPIIATSSWYPSGSIPSTCQLGKCDRFTDHSGAQAEIVVTASDDNAPGGKHFLVSAKVTGLDEGNIAAIFLGFAQQVDAGQSMPALTEYSIRNSDQVDLIKTVWESSMTDDVFLPCSGQTYEMIASMKSNQGLTVSFKVYPPSNVKIDFSPKHYGIAVTGAKTGPIKLGGTMSFECGASPRPVQPPTTPADNTNTNKLTPECLLQSLSFTNGFTLNSQFKPNVFRYTAKCPCDDFVIRPKTVDTGSSVEVSHNGNDVHLRVWNNAISNGGNDGSAPFSPLKETQALTLAPGSNTFKLGVGCNGYGTPGPCYYEYIITCDKNVPVQKAAISTESCIAVNEQTTVSVSIPAPAAVAVSFTPSANGCTFSPSAVTIPVGGKNVDLKMTCKNAGNTQLSFSSSSNLFTAPATSTVQVKSTCKPSTLTMDLCLASGNWEIVTLKTQVNAPSGGWSFVPQANGCSFYPTGTLTVAAGTNSKEFGMRCGVGNFQININPTGNNAGFIPAPAPTPISVTCSCRPADFDTVSKCVAVGVKADLKVKAGATAPKGGWQFIPSATVGTSAGGAAAPCTFNPSTVTLNQNQDSVTFGITCSQAGPVFVSFIAAGPNAGQLQVPTGGVVKVASTCTPPIATQPDCIEDGKSGTIRVKAPVNAPAGNWQFQPTSSNSKCSFSPSGVLTMAAGTSTVEFTINCQKTGDVTISFSAKGSNADMIPAPSNLKVKISDKCAPPCIDQCPWPLITCPNDPSRCRLKLEDCSTASCPPKPTKEEEHPDEDEDINDDDDNCEKKRDDRHKGCSHRKEDKGNFWDRKKKDGICDLSKLWNYARKRS